MSAALAPAAHKPQASSDAVRRNMQAVSSESVVEQQLRSALHQRGLRFRKHVVVVPGLRCKPDIAFTRRRVAVFVDGCFWHRCPMHATFPARNAEWWERKLDENVQRDRRHDAALHAAGWTVLRLWEHESVDTMADCVLDAVSNSVN